ncbi:MAG: ABC transporter ATP-binding protein [Candidatus Hodarchaeales archaeon]|jgi:putative ABC transport system ATP-binding protein
MSGTKSTETSIFKLTDLQRYYTTKAEVVRAVDGINLDIVSGEFISILGPSGSGKTTVLNLLAGLDKPTSGNLFFKDMNMATLSDNQLCDLRRHEIGIIFQFYNLHPSFTAIENIEYPMMIANISKNLRREKSLSLIEKMGLLDKKDNFPSELSGGERQRIGIARSLSNNPSVVIADEPTGDLDSDNAIAIINLLNKINEEQGMTIVMVTHDDSLIEKHMRIIQLEDGKIV